MLVCRTYPWACDDCLIVKNASVARGSKRSILRSLVKVDSCKNFVSVRGSETTTEEKCVQREEAEEHKGGIEALKLSP